MKNILILSFLISLPAFAGFDGANAPGGEGVQGAPGGYNYIGQGLEVNKPADKSTTKSVPSGSKGAAGGQPGGKGGKGRGDCGK